MVAIRKKSGKPTSAAAANSASTAVRNPYRDRIIDLRRVPASELVPHELNPRIHPEAQNTALRSSLEARGIADTLLTYIRADGRLGLIDGHERTEMLGDALVPVVVTDLTEDEAAAFLAEHDAITLLALYDASRSEQLARTLELRHAASADLLRTVAEANPAASLLEAMLLRADERGGYLHGGSPQGYNDDDADEDGEEDQDDPERDEWSFGDGAITGDGALTYHDPTARSAALVEKFGAPPFSVLDTRQGYWQERKRAWLALGIESEVGRADVRGENIRFGAGSAMRRTLSTDEGRAFAAGGGIEAPALSIFDPVLCELAYRWFSPTQGRVLDPFAGGSVRGVVAAMTGRSYTGIELRAAQIDANRQQWAAIRGFSSLPSASDGDMATNTDTDTDTGRNEQASHSSATILAEKPRTLAEWMSRLYLLSAQDVPAELGVWPEELREFIELLCLAHANQTTHFTVAPHLILPPDADKPRDAGECVVFLSGGKDSLAAGVLAERAGYRVHALHARHVNRSYPQEAERSAAIAHEMGWRYTRLAPEDLPAVPGVSVIREQYMWAVALQTLPVLPGAIAFGNYIYEDCESSVFFNTMECSVRAFESVVRRVYGAERAPVRLRPLEDEIESLGIWRSLPDSIQALTTSCMTPLRFQIGHHRRSVAQGIPVTDSECGVCEKCRVKALAQARHFGVVYPERYLESCRKKLRVAFSKGVSWSHSHPRLLARPNEPGYAANIYSVRVCGLERPYVMPLSPSFEPVVTTLADEDGGASAHTPQDGPSDGLTPVGAVRLAHSGERIWIKRDDLYEIPGDPQARGSKARILWRLSEGARTGLITATGSDSTQTELVARVARQRGLDCVAHVPARRDELPSTRAARLCGARVVGERPGHTSVVIRRAKDDVARRGGELAGWRYIPYALEGDEGRDCTAEQVANIPAECHRIVVAVGSGMTLSGILWGIVRAGRQDTLRVLGVCVGADPTKRLDSYAPSTWRDFCELVPSGSDYHTPAAQTTLRLSDVALDLELDAYYEAKAAPHLRAGDCLWVIGYNAARQPQQMGDTTDHPELAPRSDVGTRNGAERVATPRWIEGDSRMLDTLLSTDDADAGSTAPYDLIFTCPPYFDLERYSDDARDLSTCATYAEFLSAYRMVIAHAVQWLADDRFAAIVVGDVRERESGCLLPFVSDTIRAFEDAGARLYNDAVVITPAGTLPVRAGRTFTLARKLGRAHSRLLVFVKGDPTRATLACGGASVQSAITLLNTDTDDTDAYPAYDDAYDHEIIDGDIDTGAADE